MLIACAALLFACGMAASFCGFAIMYEAKTVFQEIVAFICFLAAAVFVSASCITAAVISVQTVITRELRQLGGLHARSLNAAAAERLRHVE